MGHSVEDFDRLLAECGRLLELTTEQTNTIRFLELRVAQLGNEIKKLEGEKHTLINTMRSDFETISKLKMDLSQHRANSSANTW